MALRIVRFGSAVRGSKDGAHWAAIPFVPWAQLTTGYPPRGGGNAGRNTRPVTGTERPSASVDAYMIRWTLPRMSRAATGSDFTSVPGGFCAAPGGTA